MQASLALLQTAAGECGRMETHKMHTWLEYDLVRTGNTCPGYDAGGNIGEHHTPPILGLPYRLDVYLSRVRRLSQFQS